MSHPAKPVPSAPEGGVITQDQKFAKGLIESGLPMTTIEAVSIIYNESRNPRPDKADQIIADLLVANDSVANSTEEELVEAFLDMDADPVIRDTAQVILEARKYLRNPRP